MARRKTKKERVALKREKMQLRRALKSARMKSGQELNDAKVATKQEIASREQEAAGRGSESRQDLKTAQLESMQGMGNCELENGQDLWFEEVKTEQEAQSQGSGTCLESNNGEKKAERKSKAEEICMVILGLLYLIVVVTFPLMCGYIFYSSLMDKSYTMVHIFLATFLLFSSFCLAFLCLVHVLIPIHWKMKEERRRLRNKEKQRQG
ncbi:hypothetical protein IKE72_02685 [Candidatus Saccharibacteria bacterium]|nr:hypothetical protein [Candidatus Saccharibacteria bacterium]